MSDGSRLTLIAPSVWSDIADDISNQLVETHQQLTDLFGADSIYETVADVVAAYEARGTAP